MSDKPENPPAFPTPDQYTPGGQPVMQGSSGMTLRDWFAGQALAGMCAQPTDGNANADARYAYHLADAMLAERAKQGE